MLARRIHRPIDFERVGIVLVICTPQWKTTSDGLQPTSHGLQPTSDGLQPTGDRLQPTSDGVQPTNDGLQPTSDGLQPTSDGLHPQGIGLQPTMACICTPQFKSRGRKRRRCLFHFQKDSPGAGQKPEKFQSYRTSGTIGTDHGRSITGRTYNFMNRKGRWQFKGIFGRHRPSGFCFPICFHVFSFLPLLCALFLVHLHLHICSI